MPATDNIDEAIIDHDVALLDRGQIDLAWRALCAHLIYAAVACHRIKVVNKCCVENRIAARRWLAGGGVITFEEACETAGLSGDRILALLHDKISSNPPINRDRRDFHAQPVGSNQTPGGLVAVGAAFAADCGSPAGPEPSGGSGRCPVVFVEQD
jgi:hypothetical protein